VDQVRDAHNMIHACKIANEAERDIAIRRASEFNKLFEAALKKECEQDSGSGLGGGLKESKGKEKEKPQFGPEVENLKRWVTNMAKEHASSKWTWGVDLTEDDLHGLIWGADRFPHSGYDQDLPSVSLQSQTSEALDLAHLDEPNDEELRFDDLSQPITIPDLLPNEIQTYFDILLVPFGHKQAETEPDPVIDAFTKRAKAQATKANKKLMQLEDEVDQPVSSLDNGWEFNPKIVLIPRRPWLAHILPVVLPPTNSVHTDQFMDAESDVDDKVPDQINIPDSDECPDHIDILKSDNIPDHISIPDSDNIPDLLMNPDSDSSSSSQILFPVSDDVLSDAMDVVRSDENTTGANTDSEMHSGSVSDPDSDCIPHHILLLSRFSCGYEAFNEWFGSDSWIRTRS